MCDNTLPVMSADDAENLRLTSELIKALDAWLDGPYCEKAQGDSVKAVDAAYVQMLEYRKLLRSSVRCQLQ